MEEKLCGIVLSGTPYGEGDIILNIYTLEKGSVSARIRGVKKAGAKLKFASEPFCFAEYVFSKTADRRTVISASLIDSFYPLRLDMTKYFCGGTVLDFLRKFCKEEIVSHELFMLATETLKDISYTEKDPLSALCAFLYKALSLSGYGLNLNGCASCGKDLSGRVFFDVTSGGFLCEDCFSGTGREINFSTYLALKKIADGGEDKEFAVKALRLLDYFTAYKAEVSLKPLKELIKD